MIILALTSLLLLGAESLNSTRAVDRSPVRVAVDFEGALACSDCSDEAVTLVTAEANFVAAEAALDAAEDAFNANPTSENGLALAIAQANYDAAVSALYAAQAAWYECVYGPGPILSNTTSILEP